MKYELLVTDVDGTLIDHDNVIPQRNLEAIERFKQAGGRVAVATGRIAASAQPYVEQVGAVGPAILYNGGVIYDYATSEMLFDARLDARSVQATLQALEQYSHLDMVVYVGENRYTRAFTPGIEEFCQRDGVSVTLLPNGTVPLEQVSKLLLIVEPEEQDDLEGLIRQGHPNVNAVLSDRRFLEILPHGISKGAALPVLAERLGVPLDRIVAVGDNPNDITMVQAAGLGVAVANAHPDLKAVADEVVGHCSQGALADVIERFCF